MTKVYFDISMSLDGYVTVMGGADTGRQYLRAGLVDELSIHLVPILLGGGTRMFEHVGERHVELDRVGLTDTAAGTPRSVPHGCGRRRRPPRPLSGSDRRVPGARRGRERAARRAGSGGRWVIHHAAEA